MPTTCVPPPSIDNKRRAGEASTSLLRIHPVCVQAAAAGEVLAEKGWWRVISSDLFRTKETTAHLIACNGDAPSPEWSKAIREFSCGLREGNPIDCDEKRMIQLYTQNPKNPKNYPK